MKALSQFELISQVQIEVVTKLRRSAENRAVPLPSMHAPNLEQSGQRVTTISLAKCMYEALEAEACGTGALVDAEKSVGIEATIETIPIDPE